MGKFRSPFNKKTVITSGYKKPRSNKAGYHTGIDYVPADGDKSPTLYSPCSGTVLVSSYNSGGYGNYIVIKTKYNNDTYVCLMGHMKYSPSVKKGDKVEPGTKVGTMGTTGNSTGPHLHIEFEKRSTWSYNRDLVDPSTLLDMNKFNSSNCGDGNVVDDFVNEALKHKGEDGTWTWKTMGMDKGVAWCAGFVCAVAKTVGKILNYVIYNSTWVKGIVENGVKKNYGTYHKGPFYGNNPIPKKGDLITFGYSKSSDGYDHIEIVTSVSNDTVSTVGGNSGNSGSRYNKVKTHTYQRSNSTISGYYRPNWSTVDGEYDPDDDSGKLAPLYDHLNDRNDMTLREVGYMNPKNKPSISTSHIGLAVINYTTMLYNIFEIVADTGSPDNKYNTDKLSSGPKNVINYLVDKGLKTSAAVGVAANIYYESGFNTASVGDNGTSFGICQWHLGRGAKMKEFVGSNWKTNLTGQLDFLWSELNNSYESTVLVPLQNVSNNKSGAKSAADVFVRKFEVPANVDSQSEKRQSKAEEYWDKLVPYLE